MNDSIRSSSDATLAVGHGDAFAAELVISDDMIAPPRPALPLPAGVASPAVDPVTVEPVTVDPVTDALVAPVASGASISEAKLTFTRAGALYVA